MCKSQLVFLYIVILGFEHNVSEYDVRQFLDPKATHLNAHMGQVGASWATWDRHGTILDAFEAQAKFDTFSKPQF